MDFGTHPSANQNFLLERLVIIQSDQKLMSPKRNVGEGVWGHLWRFAVQQDGGTRRLSLDGNRGHILKLFKLQADFGTQSFVNLNVLLDRLIILESGRKLMRTKRNVGKGARGHLRRLPVQEDEGAGGIGLDRKSGDFLGRLELQMNLRTHPST